MSARAWDDGLPLALDPTAERMRGETFVCFGWSGWEPGTQTWNHVLRRLAFRNRVVFIPPPLERTEVFGSRFAPGGGRGGLRHLKDHLYVYHFPRYLPNFYRPAGIVRSIEAMRLRGLRRALASIGADRPILYLLHPKFRAPYVGALNEKLVIYHVLDEYSGYLGADPDRIRSEEEKLLSIADLVLCASQALAVSRRAGARTAHFVPNGVEFDLFSSAARRALPVPEDLAVIPSPRAGYLGRICDKLDFGLLRDVAQALPDVRFCFIGPVLVMARQNREFFEQWANLPNVHLLGAKAMADLPAYVAGFDAGILPYVIDEASRQRYPLKLHEYLAAGIPIVSAPLDCSAGFEGLVRIAETPDDWVTALTIAIGDRDPEQGARRVALASRHDWNRVILAIERRIRESLGGRDLVGERTA